MIQLHSLDTVQPLQLLYFVFIPDKTPHNQWLFLSHSVKIRGSASQGTMDCDHGATNKPCGQTGSM